MTHSQAIGEKKEEREAGTTMDVCASQLVPLAKELTAEDWASVAIAYEPVWAIGTGRTASAEQAQEAHAFIRKVLTELYDAEVAGQICIQYGGSVKPANIAELISQEDVDGARVGGASLEVHSFFGIIKGAEEHHHRVHDVLRVVLRHAKSGVVHTDDVVVRLCEPAGARRKQAA